MTTTPISDGSGVKTPPPDSSPPVEVERLVDDVLKDEALNNSAGAVGLRRPEIVALADEWRGRLHDVPLDLSGALAQRQREAAARSELIARRDVRLKRACALAVLSLWFVVPAATFGLLQAVFGDWEYWFDLEWKWLAAIGVAVVASSALLSWLVLRKFAEWRWNGRLTLSDAQDQVQEANAAIQAFRVGEIKKRLRAEINARDDEQYRTTMNQVESRGLAEVEDPRNLIQTSARSRLDRLLADMPGGSIGLSGPRGAGKSSLIRATCPSGDDQPEGMLGFVVAAPVQFDPREFVLHLFAELCRTVLGRDEVERLRMPEPLLRAAAGLRWPLVLQLTAPLILVAGAAMLLVSVAGVDAATVWAVAVTVTGATACLAALFVTRRAYARFAYERRHSSYGISWERERRFGEETLTLAARRLTDIWFQQSFTRGWSGSINLPIGVQGGLEGGQELARQQMSMPDVVGELRHLVTALTSGGRQPSSSDNKPVQVRIGIDELDKIDSVHDAGRFLNEIKVLFGIPHCFFLVSLSEDAMSQFERRGLPMRDVFDSSFDDVVRVGPLDASRSVALLRERTIGMPIPFMLLCHCMAGGLPRDVIRMAREILPVNSEPHHLSAVCRALVASQMAAKIDATGIAARRLPHSSELDGFQDWLRSVRGRPTTPDALIRTCSEPDALLHAAMAAWSELQRTAVTTSDLPREMLAYCYFCASVQDFFIDDRSPGDYRAATWGGDKTALADELAAAHQAFAVHPRAAWEATTRLRRRMGIEELPFPEPPLSALSTPNGSFSFRELLRQYRAVRAAGG